MRTSKRFMVVLVGLMLALAALACGGSTLGGSATVETDHGTGASITLSNVGQETVCYVYISPTTDTTWGDDELGPAQTISSGGTVEFIVGPGDYDLRAEACDQSVFIEEGDINVSGDYGWSVDLLNK